MQTNTFIGHQHMSSAVNQRMSWWSLTRCSWTSCMEQSANPAASIRYYTWTISTSTQNTFIWSPTGAVQSDSVFRALCTNSPTYLLTYMITNTDWPGISQSFQALTSEPE